MIQGDGNKNMAPRAITVGPPHYLVIVCGCVGCSFESELETLLSATV